MWGIDTPYYTNFRVTNFKFIHFCPYPSFATFIASAYSLLLVRLILMARICRGSTFTPVSIFYPATPTVVFPL